MTRSQDLDEWKFGPVSGPVCGGLAAAALAVAEPVAHYPGWLPVALAGGLGGVAASVAALRKKPLGLATYRAASWLAAGGWTTWTALQGWSWWHVGVLAGGAAIGVIAAPEFQEIDERRSGEDAAPRLFGSRMSATEKIVKQAVDELLRLSEPGVEMLGYEEWETGSGYTIAMALPAAGGFGEDDVQGIVVKLARRLRLPVGCLPSAEEGDRQGEVILKVPTRDDLSDVRDYPEDYSYLSVNEEHEIGFFGDDSPTTVEVRESSTLIGGRKGGGKTNAMDVFTANFLRCDDALVWHIDLNGGGMSVPWMLPAVEDEEVGSPLDWIAFDPQEALLMSEVALAITRARKATYGKRAAKANSRLVPLGPDCPEILIMIDEGAEVLGDTSPYGRLRDNLSAIMRMGRAVGVNLVISTLRPTGDHLPVQVRKNCSTRILVKVGETSELDYMFSYEKGLTASMLKTKGEVFFHRGDEDAGSAVVRKAKMLNLLPDRIADIVRATWERRPELDRLSQVVGDREFTFGRGDQEFTVSGVYSERWDRAMPWLEALAAGEDVEERFGAETDPEVTAELQPTVQPYNPPPMTTEDALAAYEAAKSRGRVEMVRSASGDEIEREFLSIVGDQREPATIGGPGQASLRDRVDLVAQIVGEAGEPGIMRADIIAALKDLGIDVQDATVSEWLKKGEEEGLVRRGAKKGLWLGN